MVEKPTILIAEDSPSNREALEKILADEYAVLTADNGVQALRDIEKNGGRLAAVVLDLRLPGLGGEEILWRLSEDARCREIPVLVTLGDSDPEAERRCLELGAWDLVSKPYDAKLLGLRLHNIIGRMGRRSRRDQLTGLFNRDAFMEQTRTMVLDHPEITFALLRMDIDRFRLFNGAFGKAAGDKLLQTLANAIMGDMAQIPHAICGRVESDVFCVCVPYDREAVMESIQTFVRRTRALSPTYRLEPSVGVYVLTDPEEDVEKAYSCASEAARKCQEDLGAACVFYDGEMRRRRLGEQQILSDMERALDKREFQVYLQPKYELSGGRPCGAEALVRWSCPGRGMLSPGDFIPVFEKSGAMGRLDHYVWERVCQLLHRWLETGEPVDPVSVNVSRISLYDPRIVEELIALTDRYQVPRQLLQLEITERAYMSNPELMRAVLHQLRDSGFVLVLDDFGSGEASLSILRDIEVDILKVGLKFLSGGEERGRGEKIFTAVARMVSWLGMPMAVVGVEAKEQAEFLAGIGCAYAQGFYFAKPMPVESYEALVGRWREADRALPAKLAPKDPDDLEMIWAADTRAGELMRTVSVPFAVLEYAETGLEALRVNREFTRVFGQGKDPLSQLDPGERGKLYGAMDEAAGSNRETTCECMYVFRDGLVKWYRIHLQMICAVAKTSLLAATFTDITTERKQEIKLNRALSAIQRPEAQKAKLLIVDDSPLNVDVLRGLFERDYAILTAADGEAGLRLLRENCDSLAIVLLDMRIPVTSGREFLDRKNRMPEAADIPVVVLSGDAGEALQIHMLQSGVNDYVTKPLLPQTVLRRVKNALEYSGRFRTLVREYHEALVKSPRREVDKDGRYYIQDINGMVAFMSHIFDVVRVVDPVEMAVLKFGENGAVSQEPYACYEVWGKKTRCEHCSSLCASQSRCMRSKYEFIENDIFYVISQPIRVELEEDRSVECVLEVVSHISEHLMDEGREGISVEEMLEKTRRQIYTDPLTDAFNRRYYDEMRFLDVKARRPVERVGLILLDLYRFKDANDRYGHVEGDRILAETAQALQGQVRETDAVVRYGGDEFVVFLTDCDEAQVPETVERLRRAVGEVCYGTEGSFRVMADFGWAYTDRFDGQQEKLRELFKTADQKMYANKRAHIREE